MTWDPDTYPATIRVEIHDYDALQEALARTTRGVRADLILDLGIGAGETATRVLEVHPEARLVGIDSSPEMLRGAARALPADRVTLLRQDLGEPLPNETFDLVVSALAIHHLQGRAKAKLFREVAGRLSPGGRFVMGDVVIPEDPADELVECEPGYDFPERIDEQLRWMTEAGLSAEIVWIRGDLAVFKATRPRL
jgi:tRNA (cmo5U34)-methyltransferase